MVGGGASHMPTPHESFCGSTPAAHACAKHLPQVAAFSRGISPYQRSRHVLTAKTLTEAVKGCDTYALKKVVQGQLALG